MPLFLSRVKRVKRVYRCFTWNANAVPVIPTPTTQPIPNVLLFGYMTLEEAKKIIGKKYFNDPDDPISFTRNANSWSCYDGQDTICLDGYYDIEELEAFITLMKQALWKQKNYYKREGVNQN